MKRSELITLAKVFHRRMGEALEKQRKEIESRPVDPPVVANAVNVGGAVIVVDTTPIANMLKEAMDAMRASHEQHMELMLEWREAIESILQGIAEQEPPVIKQTVQPAEVKVLPGPARVKRSIEIEHSDGTKSYITEV